jgi:nicotinamidase-related amidase
VSTPEKRDAGRTTAVVVIDAQVGLLTDRAFARDAVVANLAGLIDRARRSGRPVIFVQHDGGSGDELEFGTPGWEIHPGVKPLPGEQVINKRASDSFHETDLARILDEAGARRVVIGGCMTQFCVDTTARRAVSLGYDVSLVADGHTTWDNESLEASKIVKHHNETLHGFATETATIEVKPQRDVTL